MLYAGYSARVKDIINRVCLKPEQLIVYPGNIINQASEKTAEQF
jgi:hypothetical protein